MSPHDDSSRISPHTPPSDAALMLEIPENKAADRPDDQLLDTEWLLTNGLGGFAMGSVCGTTTRRYHALLNVATVPPVGRINLLPTVAETLAFNDQRVDLSCHEFATPDGPTVFHPHGYRHLRRFARDPIAGTCTWTYDVGPVRLIKQFRLIWRRDTAVLTYRLEPATGAGPDVPMPDAVQLTIRPLVALRDYHHQRRADGGPAFSQHHHDTTLVVHTPGIETGLHIYADPARFVEDDDWWYGFVRRRESERHQDDREDLLCPGYFTHTFEDIAGQPAEMRMVIAGEPLDMDVVDADDGRAAHLKKLIDHVDLDGLDTLVCASDDFVVERQVDEKPMATILAGYPWFADWGRDTMISLPGLLLTTGRFDEARRTLLAYAAHIRNGLIPNRFDDYGGEPHYNTVDASLWFVHAALEYRRLAPEHEADAVWHDTLSGACTQIVDAYRNGTDGDIYMDDDHLISAGNPDTQLTWMDAKRDGVVFTPRHGKAVEINALWYRALTGMAYDDLAKKVKRSFGKAFWDDDRGYLVDHFNKHGTDRSLRPNQAFAVSLPGDLLPQDKQRKVMRVLREQLLTPVGLRTLPVDDPNYHGRYVGTMFDRDRAYHQGTAWGWLIGPFIEGWLRAYSFSDKSRRETRADVAAVLDELPRHSIGQLHEVYDGDMPHDPSGCPAQAWSVAELLRVITLIERGA